MKILIVGVSGFIGQHLYFHLQQQGHQVTGCSRSDPHIPHSFLCHMGQPQADWFDALDEFELVINCVGIFSSLNQNLEESFAQVHTEGPIKLFKACQEKQLKVIQISAIGAEQENPGNEFLQSKKLADNYLVNSEIDYKILYPGIVIGAGGKSTLLLSTLAQLPIIPMLFPRHYMMPIISIEQLIKKLDDCIHHWPQQAKQSPCYESITIQELLIQLRRYSSGKSYGGKNSEEKRTDKNKPYFIFLPKVVLTSLLRLAPKKQSGLLNRQSLQLLWEFNSASKPSSPISNKELNCELKSQQNDFYDAHVRQNTFKYAFIFCLSLIWCWSGLSSLFNHQASWDLIQQIGVPDIFAVILIIGGACIDLFLGILLYWQRYRYLVLYCQIGIILIYSLIISLWLPIFWIHPFAPIIKNLALIIMSVYVIVIENNSRKN